VFKHVVTLLSALALTIASTAQSALPIPSDTLLRQLQARNFAWLDSELHELQRQYEDGRDRESDIWDQFFVFGLPQAQTQDIEAWLEASPASYAAHLAAGRHYYILGWNARYGASYAKKTPARVRDARRYYETSFDHLAKSLELTARPVVSYAYIVTMSLYLPDKISAQEYLERGLAIAPHSYTIRRARLDTLQPRWGGSLDAMDQLLAQAIAAGFPSDKLRSLEATRHAYAGWNDENHGRLREALEHLDRSIEVKELAFALVSRGRVLMKRGEMRAAKESLDRAVALDPLDIYVHNNLATWYWRKGDKQRALESYKQSAQNGNDWSASQVGYLVFSDAEGFKPNPREAFDWWLLAARLGNSHAMHSVGECYRAGDCGVPVDYAQTVSWFQKASEYGNARAKLGLGSMYWNGLGVARSEEHAVALWSEAARSADPEIRRMAFRNIFHLLEPRRSVQATLQASGYPAFAAAMLLAMVLMPFVTFVVGWRVGGIAPARPWTEAGLKIAILPKRGYWLFVGWAPVLTGVLTWIAFGLGFLEKFLPVLAIFAAISVPCLLGLIRIASGAYRVDVDANGMEFAAEGARQRVAWSEVVFATRNAGQIVIGLGSNATHVLDEQPYGDRLWKIISARVPPGSLEPDAHTRMPGFKEQAESAKHVFDAKMTARPSLFLIYVLWIASVGFGAAAAACAWGLGPADFATDIAYHVMWGAFAFFCALGLYAIGSTGRLTFSSVQVTYRAPLGTYAMSWSEVASVGIDTQGNALVFRGNGKRLVALGPAMWVSSDRSEIYPALIAFLAQRGIFLGQDALASFKIPSGCRVSPERGGTRYNVAS